MPKTNRRFLFLLVLILLVSLLAGCQSAPATEVVEEESSQEETEKKLRFAYITQDIANPYFVEVYEGFKKACEELGVDVQVMDAEYDVAKQVDFLEDAINNKIDGVMITPLDQNALTNLVEEAKAQGIVISAEAQPIDNAQIDAKVDEYLYGLKIGETAAKWINEKLDGKGKVALVVQDDVEAVIRRGDGIRDAILEYAPESEILARQNGSNTELAMSVTENLLQRFPELNVICTCDDFGAIGAYEAVMGMGRGTDTFYIGGADATAEAIAKMKEEGSVYRSSVAIFPYQAGYEIAYATYNYIMEGKNKDNTELVIIERRYEPVMQTDVIGE